MPSIDNDSAKTNAIKVESDYTPPSTGETDKGSLGEAVSEVERQKIISDYKLALGILFEAWKSPDMTTFRTKISSAYTGDILEKHCTKAEQFISKGVGLYVTKVTFDDVKIESADNKSATLTASYRYSVRDYNLTEKQPEGKELNHFIQLRVNLVKINSQWLITGETII
jgi:predicted lipid-binding transport protein (Tim44 family)